MAPKMVPPPGQDAGPEADGNVPLTQGEEAATPMPNARTIEAMRELEAGKGRKFANATDLLADVDGEDN